MVDTTSSAEEQPQDVPQEVRKVAAETASEQTSSAEAPLPGDPEAVTPEEAVAVDEAANAAGDVPEEDGADIPDEYDQFEGDVEPIEEAVASDVKDEDLDKRWYILKVQSNREKSICDGLARRIRVAGLEHLFGEVIVPTEDVAEFKNGKRRVVKRKLYPGYIVINMALNDETWLLVRDTPGIGDFTGAAGKPTEMLPEEVDRIVKAAHPEEEDADTIKTAIPFKMGDRVRIKEGTFENFEGDVEGIDEANGRVTVMINIFGRSTPVELEHWQIESV